MLITHLSCLIRAWCISLPRGIGSEEKYQVPGILASPQAQIPPA
jgi:hypothetical protein